MESPSFNTHSCINNIANRVVQELQVDKGFNDLISFSDDEKNTQEEDEFEFPLIFTDSSLTDNIIYNDQISPRYPLFDRSLLLNLDTNLISNLDSKPAPASVPVPVSASVSVVPSARLSLSKLLSEDRDSTQSSSTLVLESNDINTISPETYCVWKPHEQDQHQPPIKHQSRGKHKKSNSISISEDTSSKRWKVRDLLKRSYSDDSKHTSCAAIYSPPSKQKNGKDGSLVVVLPPISPKPSSEKVKKPEKTLKTTASSMGGGCTNHHKPENKTAAAYKAKIGNIRLPGFLPYRQDQHQVDAFLNHYKWVK